jgi:hypothetical protein
MAKSPDFEDNKHVARKIDKKKRHARGFTEDVQDKRQSRINFKRYLLELEEEELDEELDENL